jgi:hypothetical protein
MEYYLAVRMRRFGRAFQPSEGPTTRPPERPVARSQPSIGGPVVAGVGQATTRLADARPMGRPMGRQSRP